MKRLLAVILLLSIPALAGSDQPKFGKLEQQAARQVEAANQKIQEAVESTSAEDAFNEACRQNCDKASPQIRQEARSAEPHRVAQIKQQVLRIEAVVDNYISSTVNPDEIETRRLASALKRILGHTCLDGPFVFSTADNQIIVAYALSTQREGPTGTAVTIRAYKNVSGRLEFIASAGSEMNGNTRLSVQELHSPRDNERWLIVSGYMTGANGPNNSMRVYAYDGAQWRTVWSRNVWGTFVVSVTEDGFLITGEYYRTDRKRRDRYIVDGTGVHLASK